MTNRTRISIAVIVAVAIGVIATIRTESVRLRDGSIRSHDDTEQVSDTLAVRPEPSALENSTLGTTTQTKGDGVSSSADALNLQTLQWPASEYEAVFSSPSSLRKVHENFINEPRDESWASAMESGISQELVRSDETVDITVAYVECRSTICEVAGFMPDRMPNPDPDPYKLFPNDLGSGWWQGRIDMGVGAHTYDGEGITRFIVIIAEPDVFLSASDSY